MSAAIEVVRAATPIEAQIAMAEMWRDLTVEQAARAMMAGRVSVAAANAGIDAAEDIITTLRAAQAQENGA